MSANGPPPGGGSTVEVIKSPNDKKKYRYMVLENGLRVLLISDPEMNTTRPAPANGQTDPDAMEEDPKGSDEHPAKTTCSPTRAAGGGAKAKASGAKAGAVAGKKRPRDRAGPGAACDEESSGDLQLDEEDQGEEEEDEEGESGSGSGDDDSMASGDGDSEEAEGEVEDEEEEEGGDEEGEEEGGRGGGRRKKDSGGGGSGQAPVKKAAAAMAVGVGSFSDPEDLQGLSHYLEHMLFMGSAKYPSENDYDDFLTRHGGSANAFTDLEVTNYHFEVAPPHLAGALDRFAQFFIAPLCNEGSMEREVLAVDSEFCQVLQDDHCRLAQVMCHTARAGHIYRKFSWGNKASLWEKPRVAGIDVRQRLLEYYSRHYGADRCCLVVLGGEDLDALGRMVADTFAGMPAGGPHRAPRPTFEGLEPPFKGRSLHVVPAVRDGHELRLTFQLPPLQRLYGSKADSYISHLLGHEGQGSLLSALKSRGWATEIMAGVDEDGYSSNSCCSLFGVDVTLTEAGLLAGPGGCGLAVVALVFAYINMMRSAGPQEWVWQEMKAVSEQRWRFQEEGDPMDTVSRLAGCMHVTAPQHTLVSDYQHESWEPALVARLLDCMAAAAPGAEGSGVGDPSYRIDILTRKYDKASLLALASREGVEVRAEREPWFDLEVVIMELPDSLCQEWARQPHLEELRLPPRNPYLPSDFSLRCDDLEEAVRAAEEAARSSALQELPPGAPTPLCTPPVLLLDRPGLRLWHKLDSSFRTPRAAVHWRLFSPAGHTDPRVAAAGHLALKLVEEALREDAYLADVAGLHYNTSPEGLAGMEFRVDGFSDKMEVLVGRLAGALAQQAAAGEPGETAELQDNGAATSAAVTAIAAAEGGHGAESGPGSSAGSGSGSGSGSLAGHFDSVREALVRKYRNMNMEVGQHASYSRLFLLCARAMHCDELLHHLNALSYKDIAPFVRSLLAKCHVELFVHGNVSVAGARELAETVVSALGPGCTMDPSERVRDQCVVVPSAEEAAAAAAAAAAEAAEAPGPNAGMPAWPLDVGTVVALRAKNPQEENAAVEVYYQVGAAAEPRDRAVLDLIDQILYEPCYDMLRTKQQLGYSVYSGARLTNGISGFCIHVVSARHPPDYLDSCVEAFLAAMGPRIRALTQPELATHAAALVAAKMQRDRSLVDEAARLWGHITSQRYDFMSRELEVAALETITVDDVYDTFARHFMPPSAAAAAEDGSISSTSQRRKLSVQVRPHKPLGGGGSAAAPAAAAAEGATTAEPMATDTTDGGQAGDEAAGVEAAASAAATGAGPGAAAEDGVRVFSEPGDLVALRSRLKVNEVHLGMAPKPVLSG